MKLVDILARELVVWPEGMSETVGQGHNGYLHGYAGNGHPNCQMTKAIYTMCDDYETEKVTREQWQAAVDALKGQSVRSWNGEGLPPVGTVLDWREKTGSQWVEATVLFITDYSVVLQREDGFEWQMLTKAIVFRPLRTAEQIAAAEAREVEINRMVATASIIDKSWARKVCADLHDAGYRKFEIVESES